MASTHVGGALAVLSSQVEASPDAAARVGHDAQACLQDGSDHCNVGAMPQQLPVPQLLVFCKPLCFALSLDLPHIEQLQMAGSCLHLVPQSGESLVLHFLYANPWSRLQRQTHEIVAILANQGKSRYQYPLGRALTLADHIEPNKHSTL